MAALPFLLAKFLRDANFPARFEKGGGIYPRAARMPLERQSAIIGKERETAAGG